MNLAIGRAGLQTLTDLVEALDYNLPTGAEFVGTVVLPQHPDFPDAERVDVRIATRDGKAYALFADPEVQVKG